GLNRLGAVWGEADDMPGSLEKATYDHPVHLDVVGDENPHASLALCRRLERSTLRLVLFEWVRFRERDRKPEGTALADLTHNTDSAAHSFCQLLADCQAEPGAAETARDRAIRLGEILEEACLPFLRNPTPSVSDAEAQLGRGAKWHS